MTPPAGSGVVGSLFIAALPAPSLPPLGTFMIVAHAEDLLPPTHEIRYAQRLSGVGIMAGWLIPVSRSPWHLEAASTGELFLWAVGSALRSGQAAALDVAP